LSAIVGNLTNLDELSLDFGRENKLTDDFGKKICDVLDKSCVIYNKFIFYKYFDFDFN
jgi:hypothetical protein